MSTEEAKRSINGALSLKPTTDERQPSPAVSAAESVTSLAKKVIGKSADMKDDMQKEAINIAISAFEKNNVEKDVAEHIKKEFDKSHGPTRHCIVGRNFGFVMVEYIATAVRGFGQTGFIRNSRNEPLPVLLFR